MKFEEFQLIDSETIDNSNVKRDFLKVYPEQAANLNDSDQNFEFIVGENNIYHQVGNAYLQSELTRETDVVVAANRVLVNGNYTRLVHNAFAYRSKECRSSTTGGSDIEHIKSCGQVSTIMRAFTSKDGDFINLIFIKLMNLRPKLKLLH